MRRLALVPFLFATFAVCATPRVREIRPEQAKNVVLAAARHDNIYVDDRTIVLNSMDTRGPAGFIPGYYSFSIIRESDSSDFRRRDHPHVCRLQADRRDMGIESLQALLFP